MKYTKNRSWLKSKIKNCSYISWSKTVDNNDYLTILHQIAYFNLFFVTAVQFFSLHLELIYFSMVDYLL